MTFFFKAYRVEILPGITSGFEYTVSNPNGSGVAAGFDLRATKEAQVFQRIKKIVDEDLRRLNPVDDIPGTTGKDSTPEKPRTSTQKRRPRTWFDEQGYA
jgi:hypothetical protein